MSGNNTVPSRMDDEALLRACSETVGNFKIKGTVFAATSAEIETVLTRIIANDFHVDQLEAVTLIVDMDRDGNVDTITCLAIMNLTIGGPDAMISKNGQTTSGIRNGDRIRITQIAPVAGRQFNNMFNFSRDFKEVFGKIAVIEDNNIVVKNAPNSPNAAVVVLDFWKCMSLVMGIKESDNLNFSVIRADPLGGDNYTFQIMKYIEPGKKVRRGVGSTINIDSIVNSMRTHMGGGNHNNRNNDRNRNRRRF